MLSIMKLENGNKLDIINWWKDYGKDCSEKKFLDKFIELNNLVMCPSCGSERKSAIEQFRVANEKYEVYINTAKTGSCGFLMDAYRNTNDNIILPSVDDVKC